LWLIPGLVVLLGSAILVALLRHAAEEARLLADELARQREVAEAVNRLGATVRSTGWSLRGPR
jgi:cytochrome c-type biogenesis protein CcmH/NrfF